MAVRPSQTDFYILFVVIKEHSKQRDFFIVVVFMGEWTWPNDGLAAL